MRYLFIINNSNNDLEHIVTMIFIARITCNSEATRLSTARDELTAGSSDDFHQITELADTNSASNFSRKFSNVRGGIRTILNSILKAPSAPATQPDNSCPAPDVQLQ